MTTYLDIYLEARKEYQKCKSKVENFVTSRDTKHAYLVKLENQVVSAREEYLLSFADLSLEDVMLRFEFHYKKQFMNFNWEEEQFNHVLTLLPQHLLQAIKSVQAEIAKRTLVKLMLMALYREQKLDALALKKKNNQRSVLSIEQKMFDLAAIYNIKGNRLVHALMASYNHKSVAAMA